MFKLYMTNTSDDEIATVYLPNSTLWFQPLQHFGVQGVKTWKYTARLRTMLHSVCTDTKKVLIPLHRPGHWVLMVLDLANKRCEHYDSNASGRGQAAAEIHTLKQAVAELLAEDESTSADLQWDEDFIPLRAVAQQGVSSDPGLDCGVFVLFWGICISQSIDLRTTKPFTQHDMPTLRKQAALAIKRGWF